ncbi:MAG TPA: hypothetical protein ENK04_09660 [Gammaproteobacteria bacterium]|nr:hypothetical protein [Gammaproteobacteria bacterium]
MLISNCGRSKKSLVIFFCTIFTVIVPVAAMAETDTEKINRLSAELKSKEDALKAIGRDASCNDNLTLDLDISADPPPDLLIVQAAVSTYLKLSKEGVEKATKEGVKKETCKALLKKKLETFAKNLNKKITFYEKALLRQLGREFPDIRKKKKAAEDMLLVLGEVLPMAELKGETITTFEDYPAFSINLYGGIESQSVDTITKPDIPRLGLLIYQTNNNEKRIGFHTFGNFMLTGSAEATEETKAIDSTDNKAEQILEMNFNVFYAGWKKNLDDKYALYGPVISVGALKSAAKNNINMTKKRYIGLRSALNPETYAEILYGTTSGLKSKRLEIRLQTPIARFQNGSRIFVGSIFNIAYNKRVNGEPETANVYLAWHIPFEKLWNIGSDE